MASPQDTTSDGTRRNHEQITFRFCSECSNMLYPKEDPDAHKLQFTCRTCQYTEEATSTCVFRNLMNNAVGETAGVTQDVGSDPTVSIPSSAVVAHPICRAGDLAGNPSGENVDESGVLHGQMDKRPSQPCALAGEEASCAANTSRDSNVEDDFNTGDDNPGCGLPILEPTVVGIIRSVIATNIYNCLEPEHQYAMDHAFLQSLANVPLRWVPRFPEADLDFSDDLGEVLDTDF